MTATPIANPEICRRDILIVEDHADGRESLRLLLSLLGHRVVTAADGAEGVRVALEARPDLALIDLGLPGMSGLEVACRIRAALGRDVTLVAHTARADEDTCRAVANAGFDGHLVKPVDFHDFGPWLDGEAGCDLHRVRPVALKVRRGLLASRKKWAGPEAVARLPD